MRWLWPAALLLVMVVAASGWPEGVHVAWQQQVWPLLFGFWSSLQQLLPFPVVWVLLPLLLLGILTVTVLAWRRRASSGVFALVMSVMLVFAWIQFGWGLNYSRPPVAGQLGLTGSSSPEQRRDLAGWLSGQIAETMTAPRDVEAATAAAAAELGALVLPLGYPDPAQNRPVRTPAGVFMVFGVAGSIFPFSLEGLIDPGLTDWQQVAVGVHELTHVAGVAREDDATLLAALAGLRSSDSFARYSLALDAFTRLELPPEEFTELLQQLPEQARRDLQEAREADARYRSQALSGLQSAAFTFWLRLQGSEAGLADYSLGVSRLPLALEAGMLP